MRLRGVWLSEDAARGEARRRSAKGTEKYGAPSGTRTPNPLIKSQLLCLLS
jgi:hypothetical protein